MTIFRLGRPYRAALWPAVVPQLDRVAAQLAGELSGKLGAGTTLTVGGRRSRRYEIAYERDGKQLVERIGFVLSGRREYQLLCRYENEPAACDRLFRSFRLA